VVSSARRPAGIDRSRLLPLLLAVWVLLALGVALPLHRSVHHHDDGFGSSGLGPALQAALHGAGHEGHHPGGSCGLDEGGHHHPVMEHQADWVGPVGKKALLHTVQAAPAPETGAQDHHSAAAIRPARTALAPAPVRPRALGIPRAPPAAS
jgi:hypothetical protein